MSLFSNEAAKALLAEVEKIPKAAMSFAKAEVSKLEDKFETRLAALETKAASSVGTDLDDRVKAALEKLEGEGLDLSGLKSAIGGMTGSDLGEADDEGSAESAGTSSATSATASTGAAGSTEAAGTTETAGATGSTEPTFLGFSQTADGATGASEAPGTPGAVEMSAAVGPVETPPPATVQSKAFGE